MADCFLGQIIPNGFDYAPRSWAFANGQILAIQQNSALFSLLGTTYGGNGTTIFALPNLQGRVPIGFGSSSDANWQPNPISLGEVGGVENVVLGINEVPLHTHAVGGSTNVGRGRGLPGGSVIGAARTGTAYAAPSNLVPLRGVSSSGAGLAHSNMQPYTVVNFCIALQGIFPSRN